MRKNDIRQKLILSTSGVREGVREGERDRFAGYERVITHVRETPEATTIKYG